MVCNGHDSVGMLRYGCPKTEKVQIGVQKNLDLFVKNGPHCPNWTKVSKMDNAVQIGPWRPSWIIASKMDVVPQNGPLPSKKDHASKMDARLHAYGHGIVECMRIQKVCMELNWEPDCWVNHPNLSPPS